MLSTEARTKVAKVLPAALEQFSGTDQYHRLSPLHGRLVVTDGVKYLCDQAGAYWLVDVIASHQRRALRDPMLQDIQFWTIRVDEEKRTALVTCARDEDDVVIRQRIPWTDFPLAEQRIWVERGGPNDTWVAMLPGER